MSDWILYDERVHGRIYGAERKAYEVKAGKDGLPVTLTYNLWISSSLLTSLKYLGVPLYIRQSKNYTPPKKREPDPVNWENVRIVRDNPRVGEPRDLTDHRAVYTSSKGRYIKTRGEGRVYLTGDNPPLIRYDASRKPVPPS